MADWLLEHRCNDVELGPSPHLNLKTWLAIMGKPLGPAVFGFQTSSEPIEHIGSTEIPAFAIVGYEPAGLSGRVNG